MMVDERIVRLLGGPGLAPLRRRLRQRFERAQVEGVVESFRIGGLNDAEYETLAKLQGKPSRRSSSILVDVVGIDLALRDAGVARSLRDALERLDGPIIHVPTVRRRIAALWSEALANCTHDGLSTLLETSPGLALLKRLSKQNLGTATDMIHRACAVLQRLPASGLPRAQLAAEVLGDPHALDKGKPIGTLILTVWRQIAPRASQGGDELSAQEESVRDTWARAGILVNELARPTVFLNLPTVGGAVQGNSPGEPSFLSLRSLLRAPPRWDVAGRDVFVCENPNLMAIVAETLGARCAPLVCTDGMPSAAQQVLLTQLTHSGACLHYHGDFDWPGLRIGNHMLRAYGARSWRFGALDYTAAVEGAPPLRHRLTGREVDASWDKDLAPAMRQYRLLISEESVVDQLLLDLELPGPFQSLQVAQ